VAHFYSVEWISSLASAPPRYWEAELTTELSTPDDQSSIINNPLGFKVIRIAWAEQQN